MKLPTFSADVPELVARAVFEMEVFVACLLVDDLNNQRRAQLRQLIPLIQDAHSVVFPGMAVFTAAVADARFSYMDEKSADLLEEVGEIQLIASSTQHPLASLDRIAWLAANAILKMKGPAPSGIQTRWPGIVSWQLLVDMVGSLVSELRINTPERFEDEEHETRLNDILAHAEVAMHQANRQRDPYQALGSMVTRYGRVHDLLSDVIEDPSTHPGIPAEVIELLAGECIASMYQAQTVLGMTPKLAPLPSAESTTTTEP